MVRLTLSSLRANARRMASTSIAVCLGVALLAGTMVLGDTLRANFDTLFQSALGRADAVVRSSNTLTTDGEFAQDLIPGSLAAELEKVDGVASVSPRIEGFGQLVGADGEKLGGEGPPTLAGNWIADPELNAYELVEGRAPETADEVVINRGAARDGDLSVGDHTIVATPEPVEVTVVGIATFGGEDGLGPSTFTAFTLAGAEQHLTGRPGEVTALVVRAADGASVDDLVERVSASLPAGVEVVSGAELVDEANDAIDADFLGFLRTFLTILAAVALLVATFSISNTFAIVAAQRRRASALLRAVGASRGQVLVTFLGEALIVGAAASLLGLGVGLALAQGLKALFGAFGFGLPAGGMTLQPATLIIAPVVGVVVTVAASLAPAVRASRVAPLAALRDVEIDRSGTSISRAALGVVLAVAGAIAVVSGASSGALAIAGLGALAFTIGMVVVGPVVVRPAAVVLGAPIERMRGLPGALARRNVVRTSRRTAATASSLMIGVGVVTIFAAFAASLKGSVEHDVSAVLHGDLVIAASQFGGGGLSPGIVEMIEGVPGVDHAVGLATGPVAVDGRTRQVSVVDPTASTGLLEPEPVDGTLAALGTGEIALGESLADDSGWAIGSEVPVRFTDGATEQMRVGAIYRDSTTLQQIVVPAEAWDRHQVQTIVTMVLVGLDEGADVDTVRAAIDEATTAFAPPPVQTTQEFVDEATARVDQMLGLIYVMLGLSIVIALMGIANTLSLSIHERVRELGLVRAVGADRAQVRSMVRWESVMISVLGTLGGVVLGLFLGWGLVRAANRGEFPITFTLPTTQLIPIVLVGALAGVLAAWRPAARAARLDIVDSLAVTG